MTVVDDDLGLDGLAPISLDELNAEAALQSRVDRKYVLSLADAQAILSRLPSRTRALEIGGLRAFGYRSVYFDTPDLDCFLQAARPRRRRFKVRTRSYLDTGTDWLEVKTRGPRGQTVKRRIQHFFGPTALGASEFFVDDVLGIEGIATSSASLRAHLATRYRRTTLLLADGESARATIDTGLNWSDGNLGLFPHDVVIIETKTSSRPSALDRALWRGGHRPERISKYATGLALLRPGLPCTRWNRVINRHLTGYPLQVAGF